MEPSNPRLHFWHFFLSQMKPLWNPQGKLHYIPVRFMTINGDCICKPVSVGCNQDFLLKRGA